MKENNHIPFNNLATAKEGARRSLLCGLEGWQAGEDVGERRLLAMTASPHLRRDGEGSTWQWKGNRLFLFFPVLPTASWAWLKTSEFCIHTRDRKKSSSLRHAMLLLPSLKRRKAPLSWWRFQIGAQARRCCLQGGYRERGGAKRTSGRLIRRSRVHLDP